MSAEVLRRASVAIRNDCADLDTWLGDVDRPFYLAVADLLSLTAAWLDDEWPDPHGMPMDWASSTGEAAERVKTALRVARAYLGSES